MMPPRPDSPTTEPEVKGGIKGAIEAYRFKADMARQKNIEFFLQHSGDLANTPPIHRAMRSSLHAMRKAGLNCTPLIYCLDEVSRLSPDDEGKSRKEGLQLLEESPVIIPGVGMSGMHAPEEPIGRLGHLKRFFTGG